MRLAVTGATGFVGSHLLDRALAAGHHVAALTRRSQPPRERVTWIDGALDDAPALARLAEGADAAIHVAGVLNAPDEAGFDAGNVAGTAAMLESARCAGVKRFVHVSSLAARESGLSLYGASKARSEKLVEAASLSTAIVRPPAVYGPGDRETLDLFRMAKRGVVLLPPAGRLSLIHVDDLADLLLALADPAAPQELLIEPDDGRAGGWSHQEFAQALGTAVGRAKVATVAAPSPLLHFAARIDKLVRGTRAKLTPDRAAYFSHPDWVVDAARAAPATLWRAKVATTDGLAATARWYREAGWL
ncbi:NAD(P)-dependent oxidoreductase [Sphingomonas sp. LY160]|uniref:NAD-dependent epimerase/dehydratase family protein n=1 Tax=Sphingomonas sp. LY160 TaxID=3095342 RepID=UPI002ADEDF89|nr:NAD(P)-dependent oxidoreductase [Sphingomonas sp. LY160]MEA1072839.1 NAD(P)-dependent oxidoreductase [Sphingomonas sp. LY160]